jgi:hypothetical protein
VPLPNGEKNVAIARSYYAGPTSPFACKFEAREVRQLRSYLRKTARRIAANIAKLPELVTEAKIKFRAISVRFQRAF